MIITHRGVRYTLADVEHRFGYGDLPGAREQVAIFWLAPGDTVADPNLSDRVIAGPGRVEFRRDRRGSTSTTLTKPHSTVAEEARA